MASFIKSDLEFILAQILIAEQNAAGTPLQALIADATLPFGLRTVDGSNNNLLPGQGLFGAADTLFPRATTPVFLNDADGDVFGPVTNNNYGAPGSVADADPRLISNLIVDMTSNNPAAIAAAAANAGAVLVTSPGIDGVFGTPDDTQVWQIPNITPDVGLSAPFNSWMTLFGQFFDHGLDLVTKGGPGVGTVYIPILPGDPLYVIGGPNFMPVTRTTPFAGPGADGILVDDPSTLVNEAADNTTHEAQNTTTSFVDQNQTYTSVSSHQVFLREYVLNIAGDPVATGKLLDGAAGGLPTWAEVKAQAADMLGIQLIDTDVLNVPLLRTDAYGKFIPGPTGFAQIIVGLGLDGIANTVDDIVVQGDPAANGGLGVLLPPTTIRTGHAFLNDIAHAAAPNGLPDTDSAVGLANSPASSTAGFYDNELLDAHFITGDGRGNENIGLTTVHFVFHAEHNRLVQHTIDTILATGDAAFIAQWQLPDGSWNGERLFQAAKFGTEMQYQHLVFEEFARKVQPEVNVFAGYNVQIDPSIVAEFAHTVYRFGHSMLTETIDRFDPNFNVISSAADPAGQQIGLIAAFLNPLEFLASGPTQAEAAGAIVRGMTRQVGNEIDEFVTEALRNNLVGLPLDLAAINIARGRDTGVPTLNAARAQFYAATSDAQLKPYESWVEFAQHAKHPLSVVNFIAAYGTHADILGAIDKRAAALNIVLGAVDGGTVQQQDYFNFLNSAGSWANSSFGVTITGVNAIDFWIGGLAEAQSPFGGLLGSSFNFIFETQLEALQNGDRLYYLSRLAGLNFLTEMENNSFAALVMQNTDATHLPGDVFSTPSFILEVDKAKQYTGLGIDGRADPLGGNIFFPEVVRNNPATPGTDTNYLQYNGVGHVVLGGTNPGNAFNPTGNDILIAGIGDDTLWGDGGNDRLEGGDGADMLNGGDGDDIITDLGGVDNIKGGAGNDVINAGPGLLDLILAGDGHDFVVAGRDPKEVFGGNGNDFLLAADAGTTLIGNDGSDWLEGGPEGDALIGDNGNPFDLGTGPGHDVLIGLGGANDLHAEGGNDILLGGVGVDFLEGMIGFDWAAYKNETAGITADMAFVDPIVAPLPINDPRALFDRFLTVEGLSGSHFGDHLIGDNLTSVELALNQGALTVADMGLITGLGALLGPAIAAAGFSSGNIILGGGGSDVIEGKGGNDFIDGDAWLNAQISAPDLNNPGSFIRADSMNEIQAAMFAGDINPGELSIVREILFANGAGSSDTAVFSGVMANYTIALGVNAGGVYDGSGVITDNVGLDGTDILRNIERLQFADQLVVLNANGNALPVGLLTIDDPTPIENQLLTASALGVTDANNPGGAIAAPSYAWQVEAIPNSGIFADIASGAAFTPGDAQVGLRLRVRAVYTDALGVQESVLSAPTAAVINVNDAPQGTVQINDTTPTEGQLLTAFSAIIDADGLVGVVFNHQWQSSPNVAVPVWTNIAGATASTFSPAQAQAGQLLRVVVSYIDNQGGAESVASLATAAVIDVATITGTNGANVLNGTPGVDAISGLGGNDTLNGLAGNDFLDGGIGNDTLNGGTGDDAMTGGAGNDIFVVDSVLDQVIEQLAGGTDTVRTTLNAYTLGTNVENATFIGAGNFVGIGNILANVVTGAAGADTLTGLAGNDTLNGVGGADRFVATDLDGNDSYIGGTGIDTYDLSLTTAIATVNLGAGTSSSLQTGNDTLATMENVTGGQGNDTIVGSAAANVLNGFTGDDTINGGGGADTIDGGIGNDILNGGGGADTLIGGANNDTMNGGNGADIFVFAAGLGSDTIIGFDANAAGGQDRLSVVPLGITAATFAIRVSILDLGADTQVTIDGVDTITLLGVNGVGANLIDLNDFLVA